MNRRSIHVVLFITMVLAVASTARAGLQTEVDRMIRLADLRGATVAVSVRRAEDSLPLVDIGGSQPLIPASNMKLITTGAALHALGPEFSFNTKLVHADDELVILGDGDPAFGDPQLLKQMRTDDADGIDIESFLRIWVEAVQESGITSIKRLVVDDSVFDRVFVHPTWPEDQLNRRYCAEVAGMTCHLNVLHFFPRPVPEARPNIDVFQPYAPWLAPTNKATSRTGVHDGDDVWIARRLGTNQLTFYGNVKRPFVVPVPVTFTNPPVFFAKLLADRLENLGVSVGTHVVAERPEAREQGRLIGPVITTPLTTAILRCNRDSQNLYAECLLKRIGHARTGQPGSWSNGAAIIRLVLHERIADRALSTSVVVADGSGLSRDNRIAPSAMTAWLSSFQSDETLGRAFVDSLADAAATGTLKKRFRRVDLHGATVRAKTGYINQVSCLSGYVTMPDGRCRCFSIMVNDLPVHRTVREAKRLQEQIVAAIAKDMAAAPVHVLGGE